MADKIMKSLQKRVEYNKLCKGPRAKLDSNFLAKLFKGVELL